MESPYEGRIKIFDLGKHEPDSAEFQILKDIPIDCPSALALTPEKNLLVTDQLEFHKGVCEIFMDWDNLKVLKSREVLPGYEEFETGIRLLSCSQDFKVSKYIEYSSRLSTAKVCFTSQGEVQTEEQEIITYYVLNGEEKQMEHWVHGFVHNGQYLIIANEGEIVLLESMREGSKAHLIASDAKPTGQMRLNHEGQLMVCEGEVIKLFEYNCNPTSLQDLCRSSVRNTIHTAHDTGYHDKVNSLNIPTILKQYLLYK